MITLDYRVARKLLIDFFFIYFERVDSRIYCNINNSKYINCWSLNLIIPNFDESFARTEYGHYLRNIENYKIMV